MLHIFISTEKQNKTTKVQLRLNSKITGPLHLGYKFILFILIQQVYFYVNFRTGRTGILIFVSMHVSIFDNISYGILIALR